MFEAIKAPEGSFLTLGAIGKMNIGLKGSMDDGERSVHQIVTSISAAVELDLLELVV